MVAGADHGARARILLLTRPLCVSQRRWTVAVAGRVDLAGALDVPGDGTDRGHGDEHADHRVGGNIRCGPRWTIDRRSVYPALALRLIMLEPTTAFPVWSAGDHVLYRFWRLDGSLSAVHPARVAESSWDALLCWVLPGTPIRVSSSPDGRKPREMSLVERFSGPRVPAWSTWREHPTLRLVYAHRWASVWWFFEPDGTFRNWYVNLELPLGQDRKSGRVGTEGRA